MKGAAIGAFTGAPLGVIIGMLTFKQNSSSGSQYSGFSNFGPMLDLGAGLIGGVIGFLIGGLISSTSYEHIEFDLRNIRLLATKLLVIQQARTYCNKN